MEESLNLIIGIFSAYATIITALVGYMTALITARNSTPRIRVKLSNNTISASAYQALTSTDLILDLKFFDKSKISGVIDNIFIKYNNQIYYGKIASLADFQVNTDKNYYNTNPNCKFPVSVPAFAIVYCAFIFPGLDYKFINDISAIHFEKLTPAGIFEVVYNFKKRT